MLCLRPKQSLKVYFSRTYLDAVSQPLAGELIQGMVQTFPALQERERIPAMRSRGRLPDGGIPLAPCPPAAQVGWLPIYRAPKTGHLDTLCLSEMIYGYDTHWDGENTVPFGGSGPLCRFCLAGQHRRWIGYYAGLAGSHRALAICQVTAGAWRNEPAFKTEHRRMRGWIIRLGRLRHDKKNDPAYAKLLNIAPDHLLRPSFDVPAALGRVWGFNVTVIRLTHEPPPLKCVDSGEDVA